MACALDTDYIISCREAIGGIDIVYFAEFGNVTMADASGVITGLTKAAGKRFFRFDVPTKSSAVAASNPVGSTENGTLFYEQSIDMPINKRDATTRNILTALAKNKMVAVTKDKDGSYRLYGRKYGLYMGASTGGSGAAAGDANGYVLKFEGVEQDDFFIVPAAIGDVLTAPGS